MSISVSLDTGVTALRTAQLELDTTAHNIANANTPGYSRQEAMLVAIAPAQPMALTNFFFSEQQAGLGVDVTGIRRFRDTMLDGQYRPARAARDDLDSQATALQQAEAVLQEPTDNGLAAQLGKFFGAFSDLAGQPESLAARGAVVQQGQTLAATFNNVSKQLTAQRTALDGDVTLKVNQVNTDAGEIADLNRRIQVATAPGSSASDLLDQRDLLIDNLAGLTGATYKQNADGTVDIAIGGHALVTGDNADALQTAPDAGNGGMLKVTFASDGAAATFGSGELHAIIDARDNRIPSMLTTLDQLAGALSTAVNTAHQTGYGLNGATGLPFFTGSGAADIAVNATLVNDPSNVATAGASGEPGNSDAATAIANVQNAKLLDGNTATIDQVYGQFVSGLGAASQAAQSRSQNQDAITQQLDVQRQAVSGVSIDEEMTNMLKEQRAYQAAAHIITVADTMLNSLINMVQG